VSPPYLAAVASPATATPPIDEHDRRTSKQVAVTTTLPGTCSQCGLDCRVEATLTLGDSVPSVAMALAVVQ
jgi:hypothetical protein